MFLDILYGDMRKSQTSHIKGDIHSLIHSFICSFVFVIVLRDPVDLEPFLGTQDLRQEYTLYYKAPCTHIHTLTPPAPNMSLGGGGGGW